MEPIESKKIGMTFLISSISTVGFLLHLLWEYAQCSELFVHLKITPTFWSMICATLGDIGIFWLSYVGVAALKRSFFWPWTAYDATAWVIFGVISALVAEGIEYFAINRQFWTYSSINPTVGGVSVVPLVQMVTVNPLTVYIIKKLLILRELTTKRRDHEYI